MPDPLCEEPPADRFCDLILNGGIASGVVYPWALLELARHYRFKSIGGNSAGAIAAALAAAAEYGRCHGVADAFEPLRRTPTILATELHGHTKLYRLFQPRPSLRHLFELFVTLAEDPDKGTSAYKRRASKFKAALETLLEWHRTRLILLSFVCLCLYAYAAGHRGYITAGIVGVLTFATFLLAITVLLIVSLLREFRLLASNGYGLCPGIGQASGEEGLVEWLHRGVQLSAGREEHDPPLTFSDLWSSPRGGVAGPAPLAGGLQPDNPGIELQMFASNVSQGRPIRLPLNDPVTRLYYLREQWAAAFPEYLLVALDKVAKPYAPISQDDPLLKDPRIASLLELPSGDMPIVVATRLSFCFPILFSCVPVYAVDYGAPLDQRRLRQCLLSDGGLCTNFPIHLFDAVHPRWPTFGFLLDIRRTDRPDQSLCLPTYNLEGKADDWQPDVPEMPGADKRTPAVNGRPRLVAWRQALADLLLGVKRANGDEPGALFEWLPGYLAGLLGTLMEWNDRVTTRLPQVRNRVIRLALRPGEGRLNLKMSRATILQMANEYGTAAGRKLVKSFAPNGGGIAQAWREHLYVRSLIELRTLHGHLRKYTESVRAAGSNVPLVDLLHDATRPPGPLAEAPHSFDPGSACLTVSQRDALIRAVRAVEVLQAQLSVDHEHFGPYLPIPEPELHLRPPM